MDVQFDQLPPRKYFGTDGIRGKVGILPITPEFFLKLGWAFGKVLARSGYGKVIIGKDTRISGDSLESALKAGLSAAGINTSLLGLIPTPAIAYLTRTLRADAGIVISASHNPFDDNGIKFFSYDGNKLSSEFEAAIEEEIDQPMIMVDPARLGKMTQIVDAPGRYIEFCKSTVPLIKLNNLKIVVDCANGATYYIAPTIFRELGAKVIAIGAEPDGLNINLNCGATSPELMRNTVLQSNANIGIAFDGDGDRVIMSDHRGNLLDGDQILYIIVKHLLNLNKMKGGVVGTLMTNLGLEEALNNFGVELVRTPVGDHYVTAELNKRKWTIGGETCGHVICSGQTTSGDGIITALQVLSVMCEQNQSLLQLNGLKKYPQELINIEVTSNIDPNQSPELQQAIKTAEKKLGKKGRVLVRRSGTQNLVRVMVEGPNATQVNACVHELAQVVEAIFK